MFSYVRRHGAMPSAKIARRSGLSIQTVSNIVRALESHGLLKRNAAVKARGGKPSGPVALNPERDYALRLSMGRRTLEMVLVDFYGLQIDAGVITCAFPAPQQVFDFVADCLPKILYRHRLTKEKLARLGIACPNRIWEWGDLVNAPNGAMDDWEELDLEGAFGIVTELSMVLENDATGVCVAEHLPVRGHDLHDFADLFLGFFMGGGLVLDGKVVWGRTHNAAAFGPLPVPDGQGGTAQLLDVASLHALDAELTSRGFDSDDLRSRNCAWKLFEPALTDWTETNRHG